VTVIAHHAGEHLILSAAIGSGLLSAGLIVVRARIAQLARRRWRRHP
jgi:hypothetical protein